MCFWKTCNWKETLHPMWKLRMEGLAWRVEAGGVRDLSLGDMLDAVWCRWNVSKSEIGSRINKTKMCCMIRAWSLTFDLSPACSQMCSLITDDHLMPECCLSAASSSSIITPPPPPGIIVLLLIFFSSFIGVFKHVQLSCGLIHPHVSQLRSVRPFSFS